MNPVQNVPEQQYKGRILPRRLATPMLDEKHLGLDHQVRGSSTLQSTGKDDHEDA